MQRTQLSEPIVERIRGEVRRLAPSQEVDDLAQEACVRVIEKEGLWREERGRFSAWAATVARNLTLSRRTRDRREVDARLDVARDLPGDSEGASIGGQLSEDRIAWVLRQFGRLPEGERQVLTWHYLENRTLTSIAEDLGISQPAVSQRLAKALTELRRRAHTEGLMGLGLGTWIGAHKMKLALLGAAATTLVVAQDWFGDDPTAEHQGSTLAYPGSGFAASLDTAMDPDGNLIWCASAPLAWAALREHLGGPLELPGGNATLDALNRSSFDAAGLDPRSYVAGAGSIGDGSIERMQQELIADFGQGRDPVLDQLEASGLEGMAYTYAFLFKSIQWHVEFEQLPEALDFQWRESIPEDPTIPPVARSRERSSGVQAFGLGKFDPHKFEWHKKMAEQIRIYESEDTDEFAVDLGSQDQGDRILLARVDPGETLEATVERALELASWAPGKMRDEDSLRVPVIDFDLDHRFQLTDLASAANGPDGMAGAIQKVRFRLDHQGALLKSRFHYMLGMGMVPPEPRKLHFDRPFLVLMRGADQPAYFAMWIGNPELLVGVE